MISVKASAISAVFMLNKNRLNLLTTLINASLAFTYTTHSKASSSVFLLPDK